MMKKICLATALLFSLTISAQTPQGIKYQAVARTTGGELITNQSINVRISIIDSANGGNTAYQETHKTNTNPFGLFNIEIGNGSTPSGSFQNIAWGSGNKWIKIELDPSGGTDYVLMGTSELLSVPYALYAANAINTDFSFDTTTNLLSITDGGGTHSVDLDALDGGGGGSGNGWNLTGNNGIDAGIHFIGTINDVPLRFRINNEHAGMIEKTLENTFFGHLTGVSNTTGQGNTAIGKSAFTTNTEGYYNTAMGIFSMTSNTLGRNNAAYGVSSLYKNTTGSDNAAFGYQALFDNINGNNNTATGTFALVHNTGAFNNSAHGHQAMRDNTTGSNNTAVGVTALASNTTSDYNTAIGVEALFYNTTGYNNTASGGTAMYSNTTGYYNTAIGYSALDSNFTGNSNTAIGYHANVGGPNLTNATAIGANAVVSSSNSVVLGNNANVGIGVSSPARKLHVSDVMRLEPRSTAPLNPAEGDIYMDSVTHKLMVYDGATWQACW